MQCPIHSGHRQSRKCACSFGGIYPDCCVNECGKYRMCSAGKCVCSYGENNKGKCRRCMNVCKDNEVCKKGMERRFIRKHKYRLFTISNTYQINILIKVCVHFKKFFCRFGCGICGYDIDFFPDAQSSKTTKLLAFKVFPISA